MLIMLPLRELQADFADLLRGKTSDQILQHVRGDGWPPACGTAGKIADASAQKK